MGSKLPIIYRPWQDSVFKESLDIFLHGGLPIIDLETSGICRHALRTGGCIYCDSFSLIGNYDQDELNLNEVKNLIDQALDLDLKWVFICGLGEPTNDTKFYKIVDYLYEHGVNISVFSNGIGYTYETCNFLRSRDVNLIIKCDSLDTRIFNFLLGGTKASELKVAESILETISDLLNIGYGGQNPTNLALSIVPTKMNLKNVPSVVKFCKQNTIFPLIGELERAGKAKSIYAKIAPSYEELKSLRREIDKILGYTYEIPICPAIISGLHINNVGDCIAHRLSGLSCPWFTLEEPDVKVLGNVRRMSLKKLRNELIKYRKRLLNSGLLEKFVQEFEKKNKRHVFGGCGGSGHLIVKSLISIYLRG